jgi:lipoate-protein ligase A
LRSSLLGHAATAEELAGRPISFAEAEDAMIAGIAEALAIDLIPGELSDAERNWAVALQRERYGNPEWTARV